MRKKTRQSRTTRLAHIARIIGEVPLDTLGAMSIERYISTRKAEGAANSTINTEVATFRLAHRWGREVAADQVSDLQFPRKLKETPVRSRRTPTDAEVLRVLEHFCEGWPRLAFRVAWETGARPHELHVRVCDVELEDDGVGWIRLDGKTGPRTVPVSALLARDLLAWAEQHHRHGEDTLFGVAEYTITRRLRQENRAACAAADVPHFHPYGLRRATDDRLGRERVDPATWAAFTGHSVETAARKYRQVTKEDLRLARRGSGARVISVDFKRSGGSD
jgi:integrase